MDSIRHINYKSDFIVRERFRDAAGAFVAIPAEVDFELRYWVKPGRQFIASRVGGEYTNCTPDGDALLVIFKDHGFCEGVLKHELHLRLVNGFMPDGVQNVYYPEDMAVQLWHLGDDALGVIESGVVAAYTRGLPFTFDDFTPAQIEILQRPALEAAEKADAATTRANTAAAKAERLTGELSRTGARVFKDCTDATSDAQTATRNADTATADAQAATTAACDATDKVLKQAQELDTTSAAAVRDCNTAKTAADKSKAAADIAGRSAHAHPSKRSPTVRNWQPPRCPTASASIARHSSLSATLCRVSSVPACCHPPHSRMSFTRLSAVLPEWSPTAGFCRSVPALPASMSYPPAARASIRP